MPLSWVRCGVALAVSLLVLLAIARPASAQGPAFCCLPNGDCESMTPYQCLVLGGIFHPGSDACAAPCDPLVRDVVTAPDGTIYVVLNDPDHVIRMVPAAGK